MDDGSANMESLATRPEFARFRTISPALIAGRSTEGPSYRIRRPGGTDNYLLIVSLAGTGRVASGSRERRIGPGEAALWRPGTPHDYGTASGADEWRILWAHFLPPTDWAPLLSPPTAWPGFACVRTREPERIAARFADLERALGRADAFSERLGLNALEEILTLLHDPAIADADLRDPRILAAEAFVAREFRREIGLGDVARTVGLSPSRLSHLYRAETGRGLRETIEAVRLAHARRLLRHTSLPVGAVASACGFADPYYFSRRFRAATGSSPLAFRRENEENTVLRATSEETGT